MLKELISRLWDGRFKQGLAFNLADFGVTHFPNRANLLIVHFFTVVSQHTGHWPWMIFEAGYCGGPRAAWHIGVLGFTVGKIIVNDYDDSTGEIVGPDKNKYYWFFKGLNHKGKQLEEII